LECSRNLTPRGQQIAFTTWSPDGHWIADEERLSDRVPRSSGKIQQLTHFDAPSEYVRHPAWSPRNEQVVFRHTTSGASIFVTDFIP